MAKRISRQSQQQQLMQSWGVRAGLAIIFLGLAYGFISLAIDTGSLLEYTAAILSLWYGVVNAIKAVKLGFSH